MHHINLSPLHQVEYAVPDLDAASRFFEELFGESEVESAFSSVLSNPALAIRHVGFGQTVQQLCVPLMQGLPHYDALMAQGPCVHNLCYLVDNIDNIVRNCQEAGFRPLIDFPLNDIWAQALPAENIQGNHHSYIMDTRDVLGFQLELAETPWIQEPNPPLMLPAYGPQWSSTEAQCDNKLLAINVVVANLEHTLEALRTVFSNSVNIIEETHDQHSGKSRIALLELGEVSMVYMEPGAEHIEFAAFLDQRGPAVHSLVAELNDFENIKSKIQESGIPTGIPDNALLTATACATDTPAASLQLHALDVIGVEFTLLSKSS